MWQHLKFLLNLWIHPETSESSLQTEQTFSLYLAKEETDACVVCRLSCSGLLFGREAHWTWAARKNVNIELKISICTWKRPTNLQDTWKFDGSGNQTKSPCTQDWGTWGVGPWHPFCIPQATEAVLQVALCFWGACNNPIWGWALISLCPLAHLICWLVEGQAYRQSGAMICKTLPGTFDKDTCSLWMLPGELLFSSRPCRGWTWIWIFGSRQLFYPILNTRSA